MNDLDNKLDIAAAPKDIVIPQKREITHAKSQEEIEADFDFARSNIYEIIDLGQEAMVAAIEVAKQSQQPRAYEVVATLIKALLDANSDLLDIRIKTKKIKEDETPKSGDNHNHIHLGSNMTTTEFQKMITDASGKSGTGQET